MTDASRRSVAATHLLSVPAEEVARRALAFESIHEWHPAFKSGTTEGEGPGAIRLLDMGGSPVRERLDEIAEDELTYRYTVLQHPLIPAGSLGAVSVRSSDDGSTEVSWTISFSITDPFVPIEAFEKLVVGFVKMGLYGLADSFEGDTKA